MPSSCSLIVKAYVIIMLKEISGLRYFAEASSEIDVKSVQTNST